MMELVQVTITGADDSVNVEDLVKLQSEFPFVEWGILFSGSRQGGPRFPSPMWIHRLLGLNLNLSAHLCGAYVRDALVQSERGLHKWKTDFPTEWPIFNRIQLNFHSYPHLISSAFVGATNYIYQCDGVNDPMVRDLVSRFGGSPLFDTSGGAGILPSQWPERWDNTYCGYAGGLGPENVETELHRIAQRGPDGCNFWIDMERRVRSEDDSILDLDKVRSVLEQMAPYAGR